MFRWRSQDKFRESQVRRKPQAGKLERRSISEISGFRERISGLKYPRVQIVPIEATVWINGIESAKSVADLKTL